MQLSHTDQKLLLFPSRLTGHLCLDSPGFSAEPRELLQGPLRRMRSGTCVRGELQPPLRACEGCSLKRLLLSKAQPAVACLSPAIRQLTSRAVGMPIWNSQTIKLLFNLESELQKNKKGN